MISLEIMYSDKMATIQKSSSEKVSLQDDNDVSDKVFEYLEGNFVKKNDMEIEKISILLKLLQLSYTNHPKLPKGIQCKNWEIKCESHPPYVTNLLESIPLNSDFLKIESESYGTCRDLLNKWEEMEQVKTAKEKCLNMEIH
ncbi:hypothetical protein B9Z55_012640 [Caenorhabditis nigoni]|uniref:DUF38 domain-containing protein n=1 Tax=Caenorhabditis nigoni TaxID=1611254 RepID=A0A2G5TY41_9PELO|nr:hypothetical protein B9Z55_012640 [Caenorhabditis nigoni]